MKFEDWFWKGDHNIIEYEDIGLYNATKLAWLASRQDIIRKIREWIVDYNEIDDWALSDDMLNVLEHFLKEAENE